MPYCVLRPYGRILASMRDTVSQAYRWTQDKAEYFLSALKNTMPSKASRMNRIIQVLSALEDSSLEEKISWR